MKSQIKFKKFVAMLVEVFVCIQIPEYKKNHQIAILKRQTLPWQSLARGTLINKLRFSRSRHN